MKPSTASLIPAIINTANALVKACSIKYIKKSGVRIILNIVIRFGMLIFYFFSVGCKIQDTRCKIKDLINLYVAIKNIVNHASPACEADRPACRGRRGRCIMNQGHLSLGFDVGYLGPVSIFG